MPPRPHYKFQQRFSDLRSFRFLWILLIFYVCHIPRVHTDSYQDLIDEATSRELLHTSRETRPARRTTTSLAVTTPTTTPSTTTTSERNHIADLKNHIKRVLNLESSDDETIDQYVSNTFNIHNQDPLYVFVLPGEKNETIVLRRSYFDEAVFPNVTTLQILRKVAQQSKWMHSENAERKSEKMWKTDDRFRVKYEQFKRDANDLGEDDESKEIVEENVRTERNFFKFMDTLNVKDVDNNGIDSTTEGTMRDDDSEPDDMSNSESQRSERHFNEYGSILKDVHSKDHIGKYGLSHAHWDTPTSKRPAHTKVSWEDLGLDGWTGDIQSVHKNPEENSKPIPVSIQNAAIKNPHILPHNFIPILANFDALAFLTTAAPVHKPIINGNLFEPNRNKPRPTVPPNVGVVHVNDKKHSTSIHQFSFITHSKPKHPGHPPSQSHSVQLFRPATSYTPSKHQHKQPPHNDTWEINFVVPQGLRDLLKLEREKLRNLTYGIDGKYKGRKWPVTSSRSAHRDNDIFIGRANNPFGHSTKWKLSNNSNDVDDVIEDRQKRGVVELYSMVKCTTGCDPLIYKGYGCYCGFLGRGRALDGIDRCCKMHDYCYEVASCPKFLEYFVPYLWKCYRGRPVCAIDHGEWGGPGSCASMLCECDRALSKCLSRYYCPRKRAVCTSSPLRLLQNILMDFGL